MDTNVLKSQIERCRSLAENADEFTKRRLLELAESLQRQRVRSRPDQFAGRAETPVTAVPGPLLSAWVIRRPALTI